MFNSEVSKFRSCAFDIKLIKTAECFFFLHCKNPTSCFLQNYTELAVHPLISCLNTTTLFSRVFVRSVLGFFLFCFVRYTWRAFPRCGFSQYLRQLYQVLCRGLFLSSGICVDCTNIVDYSLKNQIIIEHKAPESGKLHISYVQTGFWRNWCLVAPVVFWHVSAQGHYWRGTVLVSLLISVSPFLYQMYTHP